MKSTKSQTIEISYFDERAKKQIKLKGDVTEFAERHSCNISWFDESIVNQTILIGDDTEYLEMNF